MIKWNRHINLLSLVLVVLLVFGCKKKPDPTTVTETAVFSASLNINGTPYTYSADNGYYMGSGYEVLNSDNIYWYYGEYTFENQDSLATGTGTNLKISFADYKVRNAGEAVDIFNVLDPGVKAYNTRDTVITRAYTVNFDAGTSGDSLAYFWELGDGQSRLTAVPNLVYNYNTKTNYNVKLTVSNSLTSCSDTISKEVFTDVVDSTCYSDFSYFAFQDTLGFQTSFWLEDTLNIAFPFNQILWEFGDGAVDSSYSPVHLYQNAGVYKVTLTYYDATDCYTRVERRIFVGTTAEPCVANFQSSYVGEVVDTATSGSELLIVEWTNETGEVYSTSNGSQEGQSFEIVSIEEYLDNESGQKTVKLNVRFNAILYTADGSKQVEVTGAEAVIAVAYF